MKKIAIRVWRELVPCGSEKVLVYWVLPDTFFDVFLFTCRNCGAIFGVDREREHYSGRPFEELRQSLTCPACTTPCTELVEYPQTFVCPDGSEGHWDPPRTYPPDTELVTLEVWDPYG